MGSDESGSDGVGVGGEVAAARDALQRRCSSQRRGPREKYEQGGGTEGFTGG